VLTGFQSKLSKIIAHEIFKTAKRESWEMQRAIKQTDLTKRGAGIPESVLTAFENAFLQTLENRRLERHGYTKWRYGGGVEKEFAFLLCEPLIHEINQTDWVEAASRTAEGVAQIKAMGGEQAYRSIISAAIIPAFEYAIKNFRGIYHSANFGKGGWRLLTPVMKQAVAKENSTNFQPQQLFYFSNTTRGKTKADYKLAKKLITGTVRTHPSAPSAGPYSI